MWWDWGGVTHIVEVEDFILHLAVSEGSHCDVVRHRQGSEDINVPEKNCVVVNSGCD